MDASWNERFAGIDRLYGSGAVERLRARRVAVVGLGGVGSWLVEALARSAVGHLSLIDADDLCLSNTNRQLPALDGGHAGSKAGTVAERCLAISRGISRDVVAAFVTPGNVGELLGCRFDLVLCASDSFRSQVELIAWCRGR